MTSKLTAHDVLLRYSYEDLPEFTCLELKDVNQIGNFGNQPIHVAAVRGNAEELLALLESGANVNAVGELGNTPLHEAVGQSHTEIVRLLLQYGASRDLKNEFDQTALDIALMKNKDVVSEILILLSK